MPLSLIHIYLADVVDALAFAGGHLLHDLGKCLGVGGEDGGEQFKESCLITDEVIKTISELSHLAPLHNPAGILGIEAPRKVFGPDIPMVAVFDTAFHSTMPPKAYMLSLIHI